MVYTCILISPEGVDVRYHNVEAGRHKEALEKAQEHFGVETCDLGYSDDGWVIDVMMEE